MSEEIKQAVALPEAGSLVVSTSPHMQDGDTIAKIMLKVVICLIPVCAASIWFFGWNAVRVLLLCSVFCVGFEWLWTLATRQHATVGDYSALVTGLILALNMPPAAPWWLCAIGSFFAIVIVKELFGGLGQNPFNPAAAARVALLVGFAGRMSEWTLPRTMEADADVLTGATPLAAAKMAEGNADRIREIASNDQLWNYFIGNMGGSLGETCVPAILLGGLGLLAWRLIKWQIPVAMLLTVFVFTWIVNLAAPGLTPGPLFHLCTGGLMIGAFFMATDMVTSPMTGLGAFLFGALIGVLVCVIRIWGGYPEGVSFAIVIMNALVPLIDRFCYWRPFGWTSTSASALQMRRGEIK